MPFWTYMLHCRAGKIYTGHTDDLEKRVAQHLSGAIPGFTSDFAPCELVWSSEFPTRAEALAAERKIKGWSRAKKLALIRGDWEEISWLAKSKSSASTSSARTGGEVTPKVAPPEPVEESSSSSGGTPHILTGIISAPTRLDKALADATGLSRERIKGLIADGAVEMAGTRASSPSAKVEEGTPFTIHLPAPAPLEAEPQDIPLVVAYEDEHLIVVDKPAGMVVHPAAGNRDGTLVNALLHHCRGQLSGINGVERPGIVHRIDKDTSGLLVVAKTDSAHEGLARQFADHSISRRYIAICAGTPKPADGTIDARLGRSDRDRKKMAVLAEDARRGKHAVTHYRTIKSFGVASILECRLETGRTHQVRVHCASIGHPLLGDPQYGRDPKALRPILEKLGFQRQALHAASLGFVHPATGEQVHFQADLPRDMAELIDEIAR